MPLRTFTSATAFFTLGLCQVLLADDPLNPVGFPKQKVGGGEGVFRIWYDNGAWHLRTSTDNSQGKKAKLLVFTGSVRCEDKLAVEGKVLEKGKGKTSDTIVPHQDGKGFDFRFATFGATDQADFKVEGKSSKTLKVTLLLNGEAAPTSRILIGADGTTPDKAEFTLPAVPVVPKK